jgi:phosphate transport system substrate-binding protein
MTRPEIAISSSSTRGLCLIVACCVAIGHLLSPAWAAEEKLPIVVCGSSALQPLAELWAVAYGRMPGASPLNIIATGTSQGIDDLLDGHADIAMASRPLTPEEQSAAREDGVMIRETIVARMGIAVVVHGDNPVSKIAMSPLAKIFSGEVRNWQTVGGPDEPIIVVRKDSGWSPDFFRRRVMGEKEFIEDSVMVDSKEGVVSEVSVRPWAIGVTGMPEAIPALDRIGVVRLVSDDSDEDSTFALSRPLFFFTREDLPTVQHFLEFVVGDDAQGLITETGLYPAQMVDAMSSGP